MQTRHSGLDPASSVFSEKWCKGLRAIADLKGLQRRVVVYPTGPVLRTKDGIEVMPFERFAEQLAENTLWSF